MIISTLKHHMAGSAGDWADLHIKLHIHIQTVNITHIVITIIIF